MEVEKVLFESRSLIATKCPADIYFIITCPSMQLSVWPHENHTPYTNTHDMLMYSDGMIHIHTAPAALTRQNAEVHRIVFRIIILCPAAAKYIAVDNYCDPTILRNDSLRANAPGHRNDTLMSFRLQMFSVWLWVMFGEGRHNGSCLWVELFNLCCTIHSTPLRAGDYIECGRGRTIT